MKILLVGSTGVIGKAIKNQLSKGHELILASRNNAEHPLDITDQNSIRALFAKIGKVDAIISVAGDGGFAPFNAEDDHAYQAVVSSKLMGQINLARIGDHYLNENGVIILTSGEAGHTAMPQTAAIAMGCNGINAFVRTASIEQENQKRILAISPDFVKESMDLLAMPSDGAITADEVAQFYEHALSSKASGITISAKKDYQANLGAA